MSRQVAFPFLTLTDADVDAEPWLFSVQGEEWREADEFLPDWDQTSALRIRRIVRIDTRASASRLKLDLADLKLALAVRIGTGQGRLPRMIVHEEQHVIEQAGGELCIDIEVAGTMLSTVLDLVSEVVLSRTPSRGTALSPRQTGSCVWQDRHRIRLEGDEPRFPIEVVDLSDLLGDRAAASSPWYLQWSPRDWLCDLHGVLCLYVNSQHPELVQRLQDEDPLTLQTIMADVMGQISERLLQDEEASEILESADPGTLAGQAVAWLRLAWPGRDLAFMRSILENRPGTFRAAFLSIADLEADR